jgi:Uma2 family endonuclease
MAPVPHRRPWTVDDLYTMPDDGWKYEIQAGILVSEPLPGTRHGWIAAHITAILHAHVRSRRLGLVLSNDSGFILSRSPDTVRGPDVSFVSRSRLEAMKDPMRAFPGAPDLAIEVLSPSNTPAGLHAKVADYLAAGTRLVWVIDPEAETVVVYRSLLSPTTLRPGDVLAGQDVLPGFSTSVADLFEI